jgi:hypothetical protein
LTLDQKHSSAAKVDPQNSTRAEAIAEVKQTALPDESIEGVNCEHLLETQTIPARSIVCSASTADNWTATKS